MLQMDESRINLKLKRNITALVDPAQHKPVNDHEPADAGQSISFAQWAENALVAISPSSDTILFSGQSPEKLVFIAKLRKEPINEYTTKKLNVPIDYDEHVTSLLCMPIMSTRRASPGSIDWTALVIGFSSGYVKFYTEQSLCLLSLKFCDEAITSMKLQTHKINTNARSQLHFASLIDELLITYKTCAIVTDGIGLQENLRLSKEAVIKNGSGEFEPAYDLENLPIILSCHRWTFENSRGSTCRVLDAELLGTRCVSRFDALRSEAINFEHIPVKTNTRALALVGSDPFIMCCREAKENTSHSYTEMITSLLPFWNKPQPTRFHMNEISKSSDLCLYDRGRLATNIVASPDRRLAAVTDDFGRVLLVDVTNWFVIRIWKGYRNAQCGWVEVKRDLEEKGSPHASFLVIYAPKRGLLEVWSAQRGPRAAAFNVGKHCKLLYSNYKMLNMRASKTPTISSGNDSTFSSPAEQSYSTHCYLLNTISETVLLIELPYTYSLYKYGDLKSRDHLLINELTVAINQDAEMSSISEILQRVALAESLEICMHKIAQDLVPQKIIPIMENLIIKLMKNYDNHAGEIMTLDDSSIVELAKRIIRLAAMFQDLSANKPAHLAEASSANFAESLLSQRLIEHYEEHPREVDEFAEQLGWSPAEVLRYLSLLALEQSYKFAPNSSKNRSAISSTLIGSSLAHLGEPLAWCDFVGCFDLDRIQHKAANSLQQVSSPIDFKLSISLKHFDGHFLAEDEVIKTALFLYVRLSDEYRRSSSNQPPGEHRETPKANLGDCYNYIEPASRLVLLFQFWLSTKLCNHWKMWAFFQNQLGRISDELKVAAMGAAPDERVLVDSWKRIYQLILESDNTFAAMIATAAIKSDTLRMMSADDKRQKLARANEAELEAEPGGSSARCAVDWECLCIDAERMSLLGQQLEDVFLLGLLLNYSHEDRRIVERKFVYKVARISVANILRAGPSMVSQLVAQWIAQTRGQSLSILTRDYASSTAAAAGQDASDRLAQVTIARGSDAPDRGPRKFKFLPTSIQHHSSADDDADHSVELQARELLHHVKASFPHSLERDVILVHCLWHFCQRWTSLSLAATEKSLLLQRTMDALSMLSEPLLRHNAASLAFKTFFQRTFERLCLLIETNGTILSQMCWRSRDALARRELNMSEDCLDDFVRFCCNLSEFLLQTCREKAEQESAERAERGGQGEIAAPSAGSNARTQDNGELARGEKQLRERLLCQDDWWSTPVAPDALGRAESACEPAFGSPFAPFSPQAASNSGSDYYLLASGSSSSSTRLNSATMGHSHSSGSTLMEATLSIEKLFPLSVLLELNRLASLMDLIFRLALIKSYPLTLLGEEARQTLQLELQQPPKAAFTTET